MKKILLSLSSIIILFGFTFGYEQYGFTEYREKSGISSFSCINQCYITLGQKGNIDYMNLEGTLNGNGNVAYGFAIGDQIAVINQQNVFLKTEINEYINFSDYGQYLDSIPNDSNLVLIVNGNINGDLSIDADVFAIGQKIVQGWKDFWSFETFTPYSINLRYGVKINGTSIVKYGYIIFIISSILVLLICKRKKEQKYKIIFYIGIGIFLFIGIRNTITYTKILNQGLRGYNNDMSYFDLGDYISFTNEIREKLNLDSDTLTKDDCKIYINSYSDWPFAGHRDAYYLRPCQRVQTGELADYIIYYKTELSTKDLNKKILINKNNNYLLENNSK